MPRQLIKVNFHLALAGLLASVTVLIWIVAGIVSGQAAPAPAARDILPETGVKAGLCVHLGATDGKLETELAGSGQLLVHGIALTQASRDQARAAILAAGLYGLASVEHHGSLTRLPYSDNQVNLLLADLDALGAQAPGVEEILRVLVPHGVAYLRAGGTWKKTAKPQPAGMDEWTHWWYDATAAGASKDTVVQPPNALRWVANDWAKVGMGGEFSSTGMRAAGGQIVYAFNGPKKGGPDYLLARDAFNGICRWKRLDFGRTFYPMIAVGDRVYTVAAFDSHAVALDFATGATLLTYDQGLKFPRPKAVRHSSKNAMVHADGQLIQAVGDRAIALDARTGKRLWEYQEADGALHLPVVSAKEDALFMVVAADDRADGSRWPAVYGVKSVVCVDRSTQKVRWRTPIDNNLCQLAYQDGHLALFNTNSIGGDMKNGFLGVIRTRDGKLLWSEPCKDYVLNMMIWQDALVYSHGQVFFRDLATGKPKQPTLSLNYNPRCNRMTGAQDWIITGQTTFINANQDQTLRGITRSQCAMGGMPAYGQVYFTTGGCGCLLNPIRGYQAHGYEPPMPSVKDELRLEQGAANLPQSDRNTQSFGGKGPVVDDWTHTDFTYAKDVKTQPVQDGERTYTAFVHEHRLECLVEGKVVWSFIAGGRISTSPVVQDGKVFFGAHDGWVYCLQASDGKLLWRFLAAPREKKVVAYSQLESAWPVYGVTLYEGRLAFSAGRHTEADGGIWIYSLDPKTGKLDWKVSFQVNRPTYQQGEKQPPLEYPVASVTNDVLKYEDGKLRLAVRARPPVPPNARTKPPEFVVDPKNPQDVRIGLPQ